MSRQILLNFFLAGILLAACTSSKQEYRPVTTHGYIVAAYVWPSCHDDPVAHKYLWEAGEGEWEVIKQGNPRFPGHYQPKQPLWGYEMDNDPSVVGRWIETALKYGVNTFIYDWYWFKEGPYLESALNDGFLKARGNERMNFYIMWANHKVKHNYWNYHKWGNDTSLLFSPAVDWDNFKKITRRVIDQYFNRPNYLKIDGCPVMGIFSYDELIECFGSVEEVRKALDYLEAETIKAGFPGIHLQANYGGAFPIGGEYGAKTKKMLSDLNVRSIAFYNMGGFDCDYLVHGSHAEFLRKQWDELFDIPVFPTVSIGWDDTPRFPEKGESDVTRWNASPQSFATLLSHAKTYADEHPGQPKILYINAWNEWVEGSYLLPDMKNGFGYLEAVRDVLEGKYDKK